MLTSLFSNTILATSINIYRIFVLLFSSCNAHYSESNCANLLRKRCCIPDSGIVTNLIECLICCKVLRSELSLKHNTCGLTLLHVVKVEGVLKTILRMVLTSLANNLIFCNHVEGSIAVFQSLIIRIIVIRIYAPIYTLEGSICSIIETSCFPYICKTLSSRRQVINLMNRECKLIGYVKLPSFDFNIATFVCSSINRVNTCSKVFHCNLSQATLYVNHCSSLCLCFLWRSADMINLHKSCWIFCITFILWSICHKDAVC